MEKLQAEYDFQINWNDGAYVLTEQFLLEENCLSMARGPPQVKHRDLRVKEWALSVFLNLTPAPWDGRQGTWVVIIPLLRLRGVTGYFFLEDPVVSDFFFLLSNGMVAGSERGTPYPWSEVPSRLIVVFKSFHLNPFFLC
jgi:hypothetical protein